MAAAASISFASITQSAHRKSWIPSSQRCLASSFRLPGVSTLYSKPPIRFFPPKIPSRSYHSYNSFSFISSSLTKSLDKLQNPNSFYGPFNKFPINVNRFVVKSQNESGSVDKSEREEIEARGESSMPERFRYLTKEVPEKPVWWPLLIVLAFMLYAWRTVLWEFSNWRNAIGVIGELMKYISKLLLALVFHFIGDPITSTIRLVETTFYSIRSFYSGVVAYAPIPELTLIIVLTSAVLAVAETASPDSVNSQPYLLTLAAVIGFAAVRNYITELFFWTLLLGLFCFARFVKKRDYVSSALPIVAVSTAVGEPWVRFIVMSSYLALAIFHHARNTTDAKAKDSGAIEKVPIPLLLAALAIGVRVAAKWAGYRHLTWMIV